MINMVFYCIIGKDTMIQIAFLYINTKSEVGPQGLMTFKINYAFSYMFIFLFLYVLLFCPAQDLKLDIFHIYTLQFNSNDAMICWRYISVSIGRFPSCKTHRNIWHYPSNKKFYLCSDRSTVKCQMTRHTLQYRLTT